jgi:hypothetical protein
LKASVADVNRLAKNALNGGVMDLNLVAICYAFFELNEVDRSIVAGIATDIANMCDNVSVISALELIFKAERYAGMREGRYPKSEFYKNNERLPFHRSDKAWMVMDDQIVITNDF